MSTEYKVFNDCAHGHIKLHPVCAKIVDTPEFQRLRNLKQVGPAYFVYPGASHNRFEHSLGVCHLAGKMVEALRINCNDRNIITDDEKLCLEIAGLCHDLGHGPFSHTWEEFVHAARDENDTSERSGSGSDWKHDESSVQMFDLLLKNNNLLHVVKNAVPEMEHDPVEFIKGLIRGEGSQKKQKKFLYQIICNRENGIDVDRWDYFLRDGHQLNISISFDYTRILEFCRVINFSGEDIICFRSKERHSLYDMFKVRAHLFHRAYFHDVVRNIEEMVIDALLEADRNGFKIHVPGGKEYRLSEAHKHVEALSRMTDHIIYDILYSVEEAYGKARELLLRILKRDLYKIVAKKNLSAELKARMVEMGSDVWEYDKVNKIVREFQERMEKKIKEICEPNKDIHFEQFKVVMMKLDMGVEIECASEKTSKKNNPFSNICFYDKSDVTTAKQLEWKDVPIFPVCPYSMYHIHGLVLYKDINNPVSENDKLKKELEDFEIKLKDVWNDKPASGNKTHL